jgi:hypothetical protein
VEPCVMASNSILIKDSMLFFLYRFQVGVLEGGQFLNHK